MTSAYTKYASDRVKDICFWEQWENVDLQILTLARPRSFWLKPWPKGGLSEPPPPPNSWTATSVEMKFWQWIHICIWGSLKKFFVSIAFVLFTLLPWQAMKAGGSLSRLCYTPKFIIKSLVHSKLEYFLAVGCSSLTHSKNINFIGRECPNFEG